MSERRTVMSDGRGWVGMTLGITGRGGGCDGGSRSTPMPTKPPPRSTYLPMHGLILLDHACYVVKRAFGSGLYIVGSCLERPDYRDVDVRQILDDAEFDDLFGGRPTLWPLICLSVSEYLSRVSTLPVDFQIQSRSEANEFDTGPRNPVGRNRDYAAYVLRATQALGGAGVTTKQEGGPDAH